MARCRSFSRTCIRAIDRRTWRSLRTRHWPLRFDQRYVRAAGGAFERRGVADVSALLRRLLDFGATGCALRWQALYFSGMKIVPALAIVAIIWILTHATLREFVVTESCSRSRRLCI